MKITLDVDCTPEEARRVMGLPDLTPLHDVYLEKMKSVIDGGGMTPDMIAAMVRNWGGMGEAGMTMWRQIFDQIGKASGAGATR